MLHLWQSLGGDVTCGDHEGDNSDDEVDFSKKSDQTFNLDSICGHILYPTEAVVSPKEATTRRRASPVKHLIVVLDLDGTLVHATADESCPYDFCLKSGMYIRLRPGTLEFLRWLAQPSIEVAVYTAGLEDYAHNVVARLDPERNIVSRVLSREDCVLSPHGGLLTKDLKKLTPNLKQVVLVDDNPISFLMQPCNGILVKDWCGQSASDDELGRVQGILEKLLNAADVREALRDERELGPMLVSRLFEMPIVAFAQCPRCGIFGATQDTGMLSDVVGLWYCETCRGSE